MNILENGHLLHNIHTCDSLKCMKQIYTITE